MRMDMLVSFLAVAVTFVFLDSVAARQANSAPTLLGEEEIQVLLDKHNEFRRKVDPPASNIRLLSWDDKLAGRAQAYSDKCKFSHSPPSIMDPYGFIGESIYIRNDHGVGAGNIGRAVTAWYQEKNFYDFNANVCDLGRECGHYTQTVWDDTYKVGCGKTMCNGTVKVKSRNYESPTIIVCKYGPAGNVKPLFNPKPRKPYTKGDWCSACPEEASICVDRLCSNTKPVVVPESTTKSYTPASTSKTSPRTKPALKSTTKKPILKDLLPKAKAFPVDQPVLTNDEPRMPNPATANITDTTRLSAEVATSPSIVVNHHPVKKTITFTRPYSGLRCFSCDGEDSIQECVKLNKKQKCRPEHITSLDMLALQDKPWSCVRFKEANLVKMKCMLSSECAALKDKAEASCCETDFCNKARKPAFAGVATFMGLALLALIELFS